MRQSGTVISWVLTIIFILLLAVLQTTVLRGLEVFNVIPNLLLSAVVCFGILYGDYNALTIGVICGLILDVIGGRGVGINGLLCALVAYACVSISDSLFNNHVFVAMVFVLVLSIPYELITYILYFAIWGRGGWVFAIFCKILPTAVYNFLVTLLVYPVVKQLARLRMQ